MFIAETHILYLAISILLTIWVARTLHKNGRIFLVDAFHGNTALADSVNHLLVVGFYLINLGYVCVALKSGIHPDTLAEVIEILSRKIGFVSLVLGGMHFFNILIFNSIRKSGILDGGPTPVMADGKVAMAK